MTGDVAEKGASGGLTEDLISEQQAVTDFVKLLLKGIKNIGIYKHAKRRFEGFMQPAFDVLTQFLEAHQSLPLKIGPYTLEYKHQVVYEDHDKENLTYKYYKDGLRFLIFREGLPIDELLKFVLLSGVRYTEDALFREDMVTRLWKEDFRCIDHIVVEGFGFDDIPEEEVQVEVEKIIAYLRAQLSAGGDDVTRFARLSVGDLELELSDIDQVRGGIISGRPARDEDRAMVQDLLFHEERKRLFAKMVLILFQILELDCDPGDYGMMLESFTQVLDTLLVSEDVKGAVALYARFQRIMERPLPPERREMIEKLADTFRRRMVEPQRLEAVGQYLKLNPGLDEAATKAYLSACGDEEILVLVELLSNIERSDARRILVEVLATVGRDHVEVFARRLHHNSSSVVKDMLAIIQRIGPEDRIQLVARTLDHPNIMIRLEGLKSLAKSREEAALRYIEKAMRDSDVQMRLGAYRALAQRNPSRAAPLFVKVMQSDGFATLEHRERLAVATALGETRTDAALHYFDGVFEQKAQLFGRGRLQELKLLSISGLVALRSVEAFKVLAREVQNTRNPKEVMQAAHKAALRLKEELKSQRRSQAGG